jgi:hypothetical protein
LRSEITTTTRLTITRRTLGENLRHLRRKAPQKQRVSLHRTPLIHNLAPHLHVQDKRVSRIRDSPLEAIGTDVQLLQLNLQILAEDAGRVGRVSANAVLEQHIDPLYIFT